MPLIDVSIARGHSPEALRALITALSQAAVTAVDARPERTTVILREVEHEHWATGDTTIAERNSSSK